MTIFHLAVIVSGIAIGFGGRALWVYVAQGRALVSDFFPTKPMVLETPEGICAGCGGITEVLNASVEVGRGCGGLTWHQEGGGLEWHRMPPGTEARVMDGSMMRRQQRDSQVVLSWANQHPSHQPHPEGWDE